MKLSELLSRLTTGQLNIGSVSMLPIDRQPEIGEPVSFLTDCWESKESSGPGRPGVQGPPASLLSVLEPPWQSRPQYEDSLLGWAAALFPFQVDGVRALTGCERLLLADDMGLGKTVQVIVAMRVLAHSGALQRALVVVPAAVINQWRRELRSWAPELRVITVRGQPRDRAWQWGADAQVTVVGFETLRSDAAGGVGPACSRHWDLVVLDEAQKIKNARTELSRVCKELRRRRSWALTGTPLENRIEELASILEFVDHNADGRPRHLGVGPEMLARHSQLQLRRRKVDVLTQLPPKLVKEVTLPLHPEQQVAYDRAEREGVVQLRQMGPLVTVTHVLELILRLKQLCNFSPAGHSAKLEDIHERLDILVSEGHRALVFSQFTDSHFGVLAAAEALEHFRPLTYTGGQSSDERDRVVGRFVDSEQHKVLILSLRAGGAGLNLQSASYVFHLDRWWNPSVERQAEDRAHRMGQVVPVTVFKYTLEKTIEERISQIIARKQALFDFVVDDVSIDLGARLSAPELFGIFGMEPPDTGPKTATR